MVVVFVYTGIVQKQSDKARIKSWVDRVDATSAAISMRSKQRTLYLNWPEFMANNVTSK